MADNKNEIKIDLTPEVAAGHYSNLAIISHSPNEFVLDFINMAPNMPQARVQSRIIMTPDNAQRLFFALQDNLKKFGEQMQKAAESAKTANFADFNGPKGEA